MHRYVEEVLEQVKKKNPGETNFLTSVKEVFSSVDVILDKFPEFEENSILEKLSEPERVISFRVPWFDDSGKIRVNRGYRVQFSSAIGPYKGGLRFSDTVNLDILKCLAFEQVYKNSLTSLPMGGGKGGSDFSPKGKSDGEIMRFCQSFIQGLFKYIGAFVDVPAGDLGVGGREIGYMFGEYKRLKGVYEGVLTGKGINWGGSYIRPEATGYGLIFFVENMLKTLNQDISSKRIAVSGYGNVAWGTAKKARQLGAKVVTISGSQGYIYDKNGLDEEKIDYMLEIRSNGKGISEFAKKFKDVEFYPNQRPWGVECDIALPCACQNEMNREELATLIKNGCMIVAEGSNVSLTEDAVELALESRILYSPGKASNAGGVACSGLEMSQNIMMDQWEGSKVEEKLKAIMTNIHDKCYYTAEEYGKKGNYLFGANVAGFLKVAKASLEQGAV